MLTNLLTRKSKLPFTEDIVRHIYLDGLILALDVGGIRFRWMLHIS